MTSKSVSQEMKEVLFQLHTKNCCHNGDCYYNPNADSDKGKEGGNYRDIKYK